MGGCFCSSEKDIELLIFSLKEHIALSTLTFKEVLDALNGKGFEQSLLDDLFSIISNDRSDNIMDNAEKIVEPEDFSITKESFLSISLNCSDDPIFNKAKALIEFLFDSMSSDPCLVKVLLIVLPFLKDDGKKLRIFYGLFSRLSRKQNKLRDLSSYLLTYLMINIRGVTLKLDSVMTDEDASFKKYLDGNSQIYCTENIKEFYYELMDPFLKKHFGNFRNVDTQKEITFVEFFDIFENKYYLFNFFDLRERYCEAVREGAHYVQ